MSDHAPRFTAYDRALAEFLLGQDLRTPEEFDRACALFDDTFHAHLAKLNDALYDRLSPLLDRIVAGIDWVCRCSRH